MNLNSIVQEVNEVGFSRVPAVLSSTDVTALRAELEAAIEEDLTYYKNNKDKFGPSPSDSWMVHNCMLRGPNLLKILENKEMHQVLSQLLGDTCILHAYQSSSMPPHSTNYSNRIHTDCPRFISGYITNVGVIFPLTDFTLENGASSFLPKSHLTLIEPSKDDYEKNSVRTPCAAGDMLVFNARTWHRGEVNHTDTPRHALTINICRSFMRQRFDFPRLVEKTKPEILTKLGPVGKRFLGYDVRMPTSLDEFYVPTDKRLYKPNQG